MTQNRLFILFIFLTSSLHTYSQGFEGKAIYRNILLKIGTQDFLFEPIIQIETYKGSSRKIEIPNSSDGQMEWQIQNFKTKLGYTKFSDKRSDTSYITTNESVTYQKNGETYFKNPESEKKLKSKPIKKFDLCDKFIDTTTFKKLDTTFMVAGLKSNLIFEYRGNNVVKQYYYCDSIKLNPKFYDCNSEFNRFYKITNGALITQFINFESEGYDYVYQLTDISFEKVEDSTFAIPDIKD